MIGKQLRVAGGPCLGQASGGRIVPKQNVRQPVTLFLAVVGHVDDGGKFCWLQTMA